MAGWFVPFWRDTDRLRAGRQHACVCLSVAGERGGGSPSSLSLPSACAAARGKENFFFTSPSLVSIMYDKLVKIGSGVI